MKIKHIIYLTILTGFLLSCSDSYLEHNPKDKVSDATVFDSKSSIDAALNGMYYTIGRRYSQMHVPMVNEMRGDDVFITEDTWWFEFKEIYDYNAGTVNDVSREMWNYGYFAIDACNMIIDNPLSVLDEDLQKDYHAQAKAIRAMIYMDLMGAYAQPPYNNDNGQGVLLITKSEHGKHNPRATIKEVYDQIRKDLIEALPDLNSDNDPKRANKALVNGLLARYYLNYRDYNNAYKYAKDAEALVDLMPASELIYGLTNEPSEAIFTVYSTEQDYDQDYDNYRTFTSFWGGGDYRRQGVRVYKEIFDLFSNDDIRKSFFWELDNWYNWSDWFGTAEASSEYDYQWVNYHFMYGKFPRKDFECSDITAYLQTGDHKYVKNLGTQSLGNYTYMRASEMVLVVAECAARLGYDSEAQDELFKIQSRAIPSAVKSTNTGQNLVDEVLLERRKELLGEGHRMRDILRLGKSVNRPASAWSTKKTISMDDYNIILPIPDTEININDSLTIERDQNKGYK